MTRRKFLRSLALFLGVLVVCDQALQHLVLRSGKLGGRRVAPFDPPLYTEQQASWVENLASALESDEDSSVSDTYREFDPSLGWAPRANTGATGLYATDEFGARVGFEPLSSRKSSEVKRVVAIGCSFTRGDEVKNLETWPALVDRDRGDLEVANLAMGAYGLDQAWLRLERDGFTLEPDEVWLGVMPTALLRCASVYRPALRHWTAAPSWKPRYRVLEDESLELVPMPLPNLKEVLAACTDQSRFMESVTHTEGDECSDLWIRRALPAWLPRGSHWMHYSGFARLYLTWQDGRGRRPADWVSDLKSEVSTTSLAIGRATASAAFRHGASFRVIVLPSREDLRQAASGQKDYWAAWCDELRADGIEVLDLAPLLRAEGVVTDDSAWMPGGHYSPRTNAVVARALTQALK